MKSTAKALNAFVGSFGLPAYAVGTVPDKLNAPYLVYPIVEPEWNQKSTFYVQGWYRTTSYAELTAKADEIIQRVKFGTTLNTDSGYLVIYPETPLCQIVKDGDYISFYLNLSINVYQMPGAYPETPTESVTQPEETSEEGEN